MIKYSNNYLKLHVFFFRIAIGYKFLSLSSAVGVIKYIVFEIRQDKL